MTSDQKVGSVAMLCAAVIVASLCNAVPRCTAIESQAATEKVKLESQIEIDKLKLCLAHNGLYHSGSCLPR